MLTVISVQSLSTCSLSLSHQVLKLELKEIREQQDLLFRFMNFLKQEGAVHVLQFCLAVGKNVLNLSDVFKLLRMLSVAQNPGFKRQIPNSRFFSK